MEKLFNPAKRDQEAVARGAAEHMIYKSQVTLGALCVFTLGQVLAEQPSDLLPKMSGQALAATSCAPCHGATGQSVAPVFPDLAGQRADYLVTQIQAFRTKQRANPDAQIYMWRIAARLDEGSAKSVAEFYAAQPPRQRPAGEPKLIERGKRIYEQGVAENVVAPCIACHGPRGEGNAAGPRIAGQHARYLSTQLLVIQQQVRESPIMYAAIRGLSVEQIADVSAYLETLTP